VGLEWADRDAVIALDHAAGQVQAQRAQAPVVDIHRHRLVVVQVGQGHAVGVDQRFVAVGTKALGRRLDRGPFGDGDGAVVAGAHGIHVGRGQGRVGDDKVGFDKDSFLV
jgi:hypothetical protein